MHTPGEHQEAPEPEKIEGEVVDVLTELRGDEDAPVCRNREASAASGSKLEEMR
jgi:hypothetical protein